jgi:hypothetical protein
MQEEQENRRVLASAPSIRNGLCRSKQSDGTTIEISLQVKPLPR